MKDIKNILIIFNDNFYKEIDIDSYETDELVISNKEDGDISLNIDVNMKFSVKIIKISGYWEIVEGDNSYFIINGIKVGRKKLLHGDQVDVKLSENRLELFKINFFIDFAMGKENYDKEVLIGSKEKITFGRDISNDICIFDDLVEMHHCYIKKEEDDKYSIVDSNSRYSVHINGKKVNSIQRLSDNDFIIICGYKFLYKEDRILLSNYNNKIKVNGLQEISGDEHKSVLQYPEFIRNSRYIYNLPEEKIELITPPKKDTKPSGEMFLSVIPTVGMMMLSVSMNQGRNPIYYVGMVGVTLTSTILMFSIRGIKVKKSLKKRNSMYLDYLKKQEDIISNLYNDQIRISHILYPETDESIEIVNRFNNRLWEKEIENDDFLSVSLGIGSVPINFEVSIPKEVWGETEDDLILKPRELQEKYETIKDMPITLDFTKEESVAIVGKREYINTFLRDIIIQIVTYHYYEDVKLVLIHEKEESKNWDWMRWLPHVWSEDKKVRFMGEDKDSAHNVLSVLADFFEKRSEANKNNNKTDKKSKPYYIVCVTNPDLLENEKAAKFLEGKDNIGLTSVFLYEDFQKTPNNCTSIINILNGNEGELCHFNKAEEKIKFEYKVSNQRDYEGLGRRIAPIYVKKTYTEDSLQSCITFFELYNVNASREIPILKNWTKNMVYKHIAAPLGIDTAGNLVTLDLHEKYHGPHGLVAGTTGSGKSEILQSLILSLAVNYHPHDVNFILIDYKGGGMANLFKDLPHLVGTITNLDGSGINRSLVAIKSELKRRQRIFGENDVNHIDQYIELYKEGKVQNAIPHLIMIADEFAELKTDQPEFMKELVSTARIGRSLGVHLILATQKPSGVVDNQIWSNSKFKLCLKVQDASDSKEVLKTDLAAQIVEAGRGYLQVGNNEIFELFQSAWSGAEVYEDNEMQKNDIEISTVSIEGIREKIYSSKDNVKDKKLTTQLEETIKTIKITANKNKIDRLQGPWLPQLSEVVFLKELLEKYKSEEDKNTITCGIGEIDDPEGQRQGLLKINLTKRGNILIVGAPGYGKTTILQTIITSLIMKYNAKDINIYILDFGTRVLKIFEGTPQVGGIILQDEEEKLSRFIQMIKKEMNYRKELFSKLGVASLKSYKEATNEELPQIVIIIDNYVAIKELYEYCDEEFNYISREGITIGISLIITSNIVNNIRYKMIGNFSEFLGLTCQDKAEYSNMFGTMKVAPSDLKGRVLFKDERIMEAQIALPGTTEVDVERVKEIKALIKELKDKLSDNAKAIPFMPEILKLKDLLGERRKENIIPLGISYGDIETKYLDLDQHPMVSVIGQDKIGKSNFLRNIVTIINEEKSKIYVFDSSNHGMRTIKDYEKVNYSSMKDKEEEFIDVIIEELEERHKEYSHSLIQDEIDSTELINSFDRILIVIDNGKDFVNSVSTLYRDKLILIETKYKNLKANLIVSYEENGFKELMYSDDLVKKMKEEQCGLLFADIETQRAFDITLKYGRKKENIKKGDAYLIFKGSFDLIKTPKE